MNFAPYDQIAGEYYEAFHKTSRNFDQTTLHAIKNDETLRAQIPPEGFILDVGAGKGRCVEYLGVRADRVIQLDNSYNMLSLTQREACLIRLHQNAEHLPFLECQFHCITAFLCDPYLGLNFLSEAYRVLRPNGLFLATIPSYEWGKAIRDRLAIDLCVTRFITQAGIEVHIPSVIVPRDRLVEMMRHVGFDDAQLKITSHRLPENANPISDDIIRAASEAKCEVHDLELLYIIRARK